MSRILSPVVVMPTERQKIICVNGIKISNYNVKTILTYFQVEVRIQLFELLCHAVRLNAGQLQWKSNSSFILIIQKEM